MRTVDVASYFGVAPQTIRRWQDRYKTFFSEPARMDMLHWANFTEDDLLLLASINHLSKRHYSLQDIEYELEKGFRLEGVRITWDEILGKASSDMPPSVPQFSADANAIIEELKRTNEELRQRIEDLQYRLGVAEGMNRVYSERERNTER